MSNIEGNKVPNKLKEIINCKKTMSQLAILSSQAKVEGERAARVSEEDKTRINEKCGVGKDVRKKKRDRKSKRENVVKRGVPTGGFGTIPKRPGKRKYEFGKVLKL